MIKCACSQKILQNVLRCYDGAVFGSNAFLPCLRQALVKILEERVATLRAMTARLNGEKTSVLQADEEIALSSGMAAQLAAMKPGPAPFNIVIGPLFAFLELVFVHAGVENAHAGGDKGPVCVIKYGPAHRRDAEIQTEYVRSGA